MPLDRPARAARATVDDRVRKAILSRAPRLEAVQITSIFLTPDEILRAHRDFEYVATSNDLMADVEERYGIPPGALRARLDVRAARILGVSHPASVSPDMIGRVLRESGAELVLLELPDEEFLTAIEHAARDVLPQTGGRQVAAELMDLTAKALAAHGLPTPATACHLYGPQSRYYMSTPLAPALRVFGDKRLNSSSAVRYAAI